VMDTGDGNLVFGTRARAYNIHSHYLNVASEHLYSYEFRGRMQTRSSRSGIGVTLYSAYPFSDTYYSLRAYERQTIRLAEHLGSGGSSCVGERDTGVRLRSRRWYRFRFQAFDQDDGTRVRAKTWVDGDDEPSGWQIDCLDQSRSALTGGLPGVSSTGRGTKLWDDFEIIPLPVD
jgi:hypothetical protein